MTNKLRVSEIYCSVQGESTHAGRVCTFVRLAGCPLRCRYCDTPYALTVRDGEPYSQAQIIQEVQQFPTHLVEITGGEPLMQRAAIGLMHQLAELGFEVLVETSGAYELPEVSDSITWILDVKGPCSGEMDRMVWNNLAQLRPHDEVKFVIHNRDEYSWALEQVAKYGLESCKVLFSPVQPNFEAIGNNSPLNEGLSPAQLAEWMVSDGVSARLQLQQHKWIWEPKARGV
ncbi:MAG: radical SAM protein [Okeania sp. SIO1H5]|uniref:radical SAM protein n=1 Tax=Okeania sp. SIO1H5 TaxID=2607777 RepID=UPI0013B9C965|nr:radical SAM protein [Okeania sp. SIO1H5]NET23777.1 radical SAM protein [Okeania sp. SIO1H5]